VLAFWGSAGWPLISPGGESGDHGDLHYLLFEEARPRAVTGAGLLLHLTLSAQKMVGYHQVEAPLKAGLPHDWVSFKEEIFTT
jgi:hypothetical protein